MGEDGSGLLAGVVPTTRFPPKRPSPSQNGSGRAWKQDADRAKRGAEEGGRRGVKQGEEVGKIRAK